MIISRTPFRVSFFGGGTDYPEWYLNEEGAVLSTAIDQYCYLTCRVLPPFFGIKHRVVWSHIEAVTSIAEILHPVVREGLRYLGFDDSIGLEIHHQGDLPARGGTGSSSSFSVGLINALMALKGKNIKPRDLAFKAIGLERDVLGECVGSQDQVAAAYGGLNVIRFSKDKGFTVEPLELPQNRLRELESHLILLYTGESRLASEIASKVTANLQYRVPALRRMHQMVDEGTAILRGDGNLQAFGELLHEGWMLKRSLADGVTTSKIDRVYDSARAGGAIGGKIMGAGGAGFMLLFVPPERQSDVRQALDNYLFVSFALESNGSTIIYDDGAPWDRARSKTATFSYD